MSFRHEVMLERLERENPELAKQLRQASQAISELEEPRITSGSTRSGGC